MSAGLASTAEDDRDMSDHDLAFAALVELLGRAGGGGAAEAVLARVLPETGAPVAPEPLRLDVLGRLEESAAGARRPRSPHSLSFIVPMSCLSPSS